MVSQSSKGSKAAREAVLFARRLAFEGLPDANVLWEELRGTSFTAVARKYAVKVDDLRVKLLDFVGDDATVAAIQADVLARFPSKTAGNHLTSRNGAVVRVRAGYPPLDVLVASVANRTISDVAQEISVATGKKVNRLVVKRYVLDKVFSIWGGDSTVGRVNLSDLEWSVLCNDGSQFMKVAVAEDFRTPIEWLRVLMRGSNGYVGAVAAANPNVGADELLGLLGSSDWLPSWSFSVGECSHVRLDVLVKLAQVSFVDGVEEAAFGTFNAWPEDVYLAKLAEVGHSGLVGLPRSWAWKVLCSVGF